MKKKIKRRNSTTTWSSLARFLHLRRLAASLFFTLPSLASAALDSVNDETIAVKKGIAITVAPGNWGAANLNDIQQALESVAEELRLQVDYTAEAPLKIRVVPRGGSPRVLYERGPAGEYVIHLTARNDRWFQYAYQFSHELCHIFSNFDHKDTQGNDTISNNQWFEETLCETASLFTLKRLAKTWADAPATSKWAGYAPTFAAYADYLLASAHRHLPTGQSLEQWYQENRSPLQENPYQREKNELVATALLPLFEKVPGRWQAIAYLNQHKTNSAKEFQDYLSDWQAACPNEQKELVRQTIALFGFNPATTN